MAPRIDTNHRPQTALNGCDAGDTSPQCQSQPHLEGGDRFFKSDPQPKGHSTGGLDGKRFAKAAPQISEELSPEEKAAKAKADALRTKRKEKREMQPWDVWSETTFLSKYAAKKTPLRTTIFQTGDELKQFLFNLGYNLASGKKFTDYVVESKKVTKEDIDLLVEYFRKNHLLQTLPIPSAKNPKEVLKAVKAFLDYNTKVAMEEAQLKAILALGEIAVGLTNPYQLERGVKERLETRITEIQKNRYANYQHIAPSVFTVNPSGIIVGKENIAEEPEILLARIYLATGKTMKNDDYGMAATAYTDGKEKTGENSPYILVVAGEYAGNIIFGNLSVHLQADLTDFNALFSALVGKDTKKAKAAGETLVALGSISIRKLEDKIISISSNEEKIPFQQKLAELFPSTNAGKKAATLLASSQPRVEETKLSGGMDLPLALNDQPSAPQLPRISIFTPEGTFSVVCPPISNEEVSSSQVTNDTRSTSLFRCTLDKDETVEMEVTTEFKKGKWSEWKIKINGIGYGQTFASNTEELLLIKRGKKQFDVITAPSALKTLWTDLTSDDAGKIGAAEDALAALGPEGLKILMAKIRELLPDIDKNYEQIILLSRGFRKIKKGKEMAEAQESIQTKLAEVENARKAEAAKQKAETEAAALQALVAKIDHPTTPLPEALRLLKSTFDSMPADKAAPHLAHILKNSRILVLTLSLYGIDFLTKKKSKDIVDVLVQTYTNQSKDDTLRGAAARILVQIDPKGAGKEAKIYLTEREKAAEELAQHIAEEAKKLGDAKAAEEARKSENERKAAEEETAAERKRVEEQNLLLTSWNADVGAGGESVEDKLKDAPEKTVVFVLGKVLSDPSFKAREAAIQYAQDKKITGVVPDLSLLHANTEEDLPLREKAARAVIAIDGDKTSPGKVAQQFLIELANGTEAARLKADKANTDKADAGKTPDASAPPDAGAVTDGGPIPNQLDLTPIPIPTPPSVDDLVTDLVSGNRNKVKVAQAQRNKLSRADRKEVDKKVAEIDKKRKAEAQAKRKADAQARRDEAKRKADARKEADAAKKAEKQRKADEKRAADDAKKVEEQRQAEEKRVADEATAAARTAEKDAIARAKTDARAKAKTDAKIDVYRIQITDSSGTQFIVKKLKESEADTENKLTHTYVFGSVSSPLKTKVIFEAKWNGNALGPWSYHVEGSNGTSQELTDSKQVIIYQDKSGTWVVKPLTNPDKEVAIIGTELLKPKTPVTNAPRLQRAVPEKDGSVTLQDPCTTMLLSAETFAKGTQYTCGEDTFTLANHLNNILFVPKSGYLLNAPVWKLKNSSLSEPVDGDTVGSFRKLAHRNNEYFRVNNDNNALITELTEKVFPKLPSTVHFIDSEPIMIGNEATYTQSTVPIGDIQTSGATQTARAITSGGGTTITFTRTITIADDKITVTPWQMVMGTQSAEEVASGTTELSIFQNKAYRNANDLQGVLEADFAERKKEQEKGPRTTSPLRVSLRGDIGKTNVASEVPLAIPSNITDPEERAAIAQATRLFGRRNHQDTTEWTPSISATATYPLWNSLGLYAEGQLGWELKSGDVALGANYNLSTNLSLHAALLQGGYNSTTGGFFAFRLPVVGICAEGSRFQACFDYRHFSTERTTETGQRTDALGTLGLSIGVTGDLTDLAGLVKGGSHFLGTDLLTTHIEEKKNR